MKGIAAGLLGLTLFSGWGCRRPEAHAPTAPPVAVLRIAFSDGTAEVGLDRIPPAGEWAWMDAGLWSPLPLRWSGPTQAQAEVGRTAPDWLVLRDPHGAVHRLVLNDRPDPVPMPDPRRMHEPGRLTEEDRGALAALGLVWVLSFVRR